MDEGEAWYRGAAIAALNLQVHLLSRLVQSGVLSMAAARETIDQTLLDLEDRDAAIPDTQKAVAAQARAHVERALEAFSLPSAPGRRE